MKSKTPSIKVLLALIFTSLALTACGGGGGSEPASNVETPPAVVDRGDGNVTLVTADSTENCDIPAS